MRLPQTCRYALVLAVLTSWASAQTPPPTPGPELKKLDYFAGSWTLEGDMKPSPFGPGGKMTETETNEWMQGGFFLIGHVDFKSSMGNGTGLSVMGYNPEEKVYTFDAFNSWGEGEHAKGTLSGDTWTWESERMMHGQPLKSRFVAKQLSPASYSFKYEVSGPDGQWTTVMDGKATKNK